MIALMSQTKLPDSSNPLSDIVGAVQTVQQYPKRRKLKKHGRPQQSLFAIGLDVLIDGLREYFFAGNRRVFEVLISYLSPSPRPLRL